MNLNPKFFEIIGYIENAPIKGVTSTI